MKNKTRATLIHKLFERIKVGGGTGETSAEMSEKQHKIFNSSFAIALRSLPSPHARAQLLLMFNDV